MLDFYCHIGKENQQNSPGFLHLPRNVVQKWNSILTTVYSIYSRGKCYIFQQKRYYVDARLHRLSSMKAYIEYNR
jgi:hypothetical protein